MTGDADMARLEGRIEAYERSHELVADKIGRLHRDVWSQDPSRPGLAIRLDRVERLLATMLKVGYLVAGAGLLWKVLDLIGNAIGESAGL